MGSGYVVPAFSGSCVNCGCALSRRREISAVVVDYCLRLKKEFDHTRLWVNGYANDNPGYIPSERILAEGGYRGGGAMVYYDHPTKFAPGVEGRLIGAVRELMPKEFLPPPSPKRK